MAYGIALQAVSFPSPGQYARKWPEVLRGIVDLPYWQMYGELFLEEISGIDSLLPSTPSFRIVNKEGHLNPLRLNSDLSQTSHCNIKSLSVSEVMRIEITITQVKFY